MNIIRRLCSDSAIGFARARGTCSRQLLHFFRCKAFGRLVGTVRLWIRRGGLRFKLVGLNLLIVFVTVITFGYFAGNLMERSISEKAFEVARVTIDRIGDFSASALLERSYESRVILDDALRISRDRRVSGILDISIYAAEKTGDQIELIYFSGFRPKEREPLARPLAQKILMRDSPEVFSESVQSPTAGDNGAYRFVKPIFFTYEGDTRVLGAVILSYANEAIVGPVKDARELLLWVTVAVVVLSTPFLYILGSHLTRPIIAVANAARQVARGDLDVSLNMRTRDEIDDLRREFLRMVSGLRERRLMRKYVSTSTLEMIRSRDSESVHLGGEYKDLTFLFSDVRGFTAMSEKMDPEELISVINFYLELQSEIIHEHGGDIDKFVGDEVMAVFSGRRSIDRAIMAAVAIRKGIEEGNRIRSRERLPVLEVGIGINHGRVLAGNIGAPKRMDYTSIGASVNLAARLCSEAGPGEVLVQRQTYQLTAGNHQAVPVQPLSVKGLSEPVEAVYIDD